MSYRISITVPADLHDLLTNEAAQRRQSIATVVRDALVAYYADELKAMARQRQAPETGQPKIRQHKTD